MPNEITPAAPSVPATAPAADRHYVDGTRSGQVADPHFPAGSAQAHALEIMQLMPVADQQKLSMAFGKMSPTLQQAIVDELEGGSFEYVVPAKKVDVEAFGRTDEGRVCLSVWEAAAAARLAVLRERTARFLATLDPADAASFAEFVDDLPTSASVSIYLAMSR